MKKGYLVLENGLVFNGEVSHDLSNVVGTVKVNQGEMSLECLDTSNTFDFKLDKNNKLKLNDGVLGKIVTDDLPIGYHVYDLKTTLKMLS